MAEAKFRVGDRVRLNGRCPAYIKQDLRGRTRTVKRVIYCPALQACLYLLGDNNRGELGIHTHRSYEMHLAPNHPREGRPREKRPYKVHIKLLAMRTLTGQNSLLDAGGDHSLASGR